MTKKEMEILTNKLEEEMTKVRNTAFVNAFKSVCGTIFEMTKNKEKNSKEILNDIALFCVENIALCSSNGEGSAEEKNG